LTGSKHNLSDRRIRIATCFLLLGAGYLLFQLAGGFPPWAWRFLFDVLPRLPDLWAARGFGVLLPLIGLLLLSLSLLILWSLIIFGISQSLVLLWPASLTFLDMVRQRQFEKPLSQQIQPLHETVPTYVPIPQNIRPHVQHIDAEHAHLQLVPELQEPEQHFPEDPEDEELLAEEQDNTELELDTRPLDVSEERTTHPYTDWEEEEATLHLVVGIGLDPGLVRKNRPNEDNLFAIQGIRTTRNGPVPEIGRAHV